MGFGADRTNKASAAGPHAFGLAARPASGGPALRASTSNILPEFWFRRVILSPQPARMQLICGRGVLGPGAAAQSVSVLMQKQMRHCLFANHQAERLMLI
jgi:hypothetical protein